MHSIVSRCFLVSVLFVLLLATVEGQTTGSATSALISQSFAFYPFDINVGLTIVDSSGHGHNGVLTSTITDGAPAPAIGCGRSIVFNGQATGSIPLTGTLEFTIALWVKSTQSRIGCVAPYNWFCGAGLVDGRVGPSPANDFGFTLVGGAPATGLGNPDTTALSPTAINGSLVPQPPPLLDTPAATACAL
eukprot:TRINITY_DN1861_c1_g1_i2.p1 TRINITY_DN1861_c1_g1~~TRINITY_DN1861_c1_g1_i2.p1  ORF type:complete len:190 (-),score=43.62 TRINITY_DN1861_c1_g1_i2:97-666(-)